MSYLNTEKTCLLDNCNKWVFRKDYCTGHYKKLLKYGDPTISKLRSGQNRKAHPLYETYICMRQRCLNTKNKSYPYYGGRGISIHETWSGIDGFTQFCKDMGDKPSIKHTIDRIDNDGNYEPGNCRWSTMAEQNMNTRTVKNAKKYTYKGRLLTVRQISEKTGLSVGAIYHRVSNGHQW